MKAMIFGAGLGTRLRPITNDIPKALAPVHGTPMIEIIIRRLINHGFRDIIVNVHHFADKVVDFLDSMNRFGVNIQISDETDQLLDTGGGLKKASWFFDDGQPFLVHNVDTLTDIDLVDFVKYHKKNRAMATLLVRHRPGSRFFLFDHHKRLCGWENVITGEKIIPVKAAAALEQIAFSCLHVVNPEIFKLMNTDKAFSIIETYLSIASDHKITGYVDDESYWIDIGTPEKLKRAENEIDLESFLQGG